MLVTERGEANLRLNHQFSRKGKGSVHYVCTGGVVGESGGMVLKFFLKRFVSHEALDLNISWPSNSFGKYFIAPPINFSFLFKAYE